MSVLDWAVIVIFLLLIFTIAIFTRQYMKSVADFLAAGRCAGQYLIAICAGIAGWDATSTISYFEVYYKAGFTAYWWNQIILPVGLIMAITGWVYYRYRQTRTLTLAQFFELRYNKHFRVCASIIAFASGLIMFGIFPAVGAGFFIYFCDLPQSITIYNVSISMNVIVIFILLGISLIFTFLGGQITVIITNFCQAVFVDIIMIIIMVTFLFGAFQWDKISEALQMAPKVSSLIDPIATNENDFNAVFFLISAFALFYGAMSASGAHLTIFSAAKNAHAAKMANIIGYIRLVPLTLFIVIIPVCAYTFLHHPDFENWSSPAHSVLNAIENKTMQTQATVSVALSYMLPKGLLGAFAATMLAFFITTHNSYLLAWGSVFIQDIVMPLKKKPFTPKQHINLLRISTFGVAVFIFMFSLFFEQKHYILMFQAIVGSIITSGAGAAIIGGLYWKKGTTSGAFASLLTGASLSTLGFIIRNSYVTFPINQKEMMFLISLISIVIYIIVSLLTNKEDFDLDKMLHRGKYAINNNSNTNLSNNASNNFINLILKRLGVNHEFTKIDKLILSTVLFWCFGGFLIFLIGTFYSLCFNVPNTVWLNYWKIFTYFSLGFSIILALITLIGGLSDVKFLIQTLTKSKSNDLDDGRIYKNSNLNELVKPEKNGILDKKTNVS